MPEIDGALRLVLPLRTDADGNVLVWGYHTPISTEVFRANYRALAATKAAIFQDMRFAFDVGAQIAALRLRDEGRRDAEDRGDLDAEGKPRDGGVQALMEDLQRLTMAAIPGSNGWETVPVAVAWQRGAIDKEDWAEAESAIVFFTCAWFLTPRAMRGKLVGYVTSRFRGSMTSSSLTEWAASLPTSTPAAATQAAA